jgi:hypothetical protein
VLGAEGGDLGNLSIGQPEDVELERPELGAGWIE